MGYRIYKTDCDGMCLMGSEEEIMAFLDNAAKKMAEHRVSAARPGGSYAELMSEDLKEVLSAAGFAEKKEAMGNLLRDAGCPFAFTIGENGVWLDYDLEENDVWAKEDVMEVLRIFAPYAKKDAFVGFIGEDLVIWSYVFDGKGDFRSSICDVNWTGARTRGDDELSKRLLEHLGHKVEIAVYGDPKNPVCVSLEDVDSNEVILDGEIYTLAERGDAR